MIRSFLVFEVFHPVPDLILDTSLEDSTILVVGIPIHTLILPGVSG